MEEESWIEVASEEKGCSSVGVDDFWSAIDVWLRRPHVVNRRVLGAVILWEGPGDEGAWSEELAPPTVEQSREEVPILAGSEKLSFGGKEVCDDGVERVDTIVPLDDIDHVIDLGGHVTHGDSHVTLKQHWMVRELIPRMQKMSTGKEAIFIGN